MNGGTCISPFGQSYLCNCPIGYFGTNCEEGGPGKLHYSSIAMKHPTLKSCTVFCGKGILGNRIEPGQIQIHVQLYFTTEDPLQLQVVLPSAI